MEIADGGLETLESTSLEKMTQRFDKALPTSATHSILASLKSGEGISFFVPKQCFMRSHSGTPVVSNTFWRPDGVTPFFKP